jgi:hypothetical protein
VLMATSKTCLVSAVLTASLASTNSLWACVCIGEWPDFNHAMVGSPTVFVAKVMDRGTPDVPRFYPDHAVAYIDVAVLATIKGMSLPRTLRVWDASFSTDCSYDLRPLSAGVVVALAVKKNTSDRQEYWDQLHITPGSDDYLIGGCGDYHKLIGREQRVASFATTARRWLDKKR